MLYKITEKGKQYFEKYHDKYVVWDKDELRWENIKSSKERDDSIGRLIFILSVFCGISDGREGMIWFDGIWYNSVLSAKGINKTCSETTGYIESLDSDLDLLLRRKFVAVAGDEEILSGIRKIVDDMNGSDRRLMEGYIKLAFGNLSKAEEDWMYDYCRKSVMRGVNEIEMRGVENDLDRHFLKFVKLFNDATKHRLAIDLFMQVLHSRLGISRIEGDWGFCNFLIEDEIHGGGHNYSRMLAVLDILYSNTSLFEESLQKYTLKEDDIERLERYDADGEGKFLYERNSEHRRKIAKTVKRRKIQSIKKHIIRKSIGF